MFDEALPTNAPSPAPAGTSAAMSESVPECPIGPARGDALEGRQRLALEMITAGIPLGVVATTIGVDRRTLYRWRHQCDPFVSKLNRRRRELWTGAADQLRAMLEPALDELNRQLHDTLTARGSAPPRRSCGSRTCGGKRRCRTRTPSRPTSDALRYSGSG
jgi:hypothetical protein